MAFLDLQFQDILPSTKLQCRMCKEDIFDDQSVSDLSYHLYMKLRVSGSGKLYITTTQLLHNLTARELSDMLMLLILQYEFCNSDCSHCSAQQEDSMLRDFIQAYCVCVQKKKL